MIITCPHCNHTSELFRSISPGHTFICSKCLSLFIFDLDSRPWQQHPYSRLAIREPTEAEIRALYAEGEVKRILDHLQVLHLTRAARGASK